MRLALAVVISLATASQGYAEAVVVPGLQGGQQAPAGIGLAPALGLPSSLQSPALSLTPSGSLLGSVLPSVAPESAPAAKIVSQTLPSAVLPAVAPSAPAAISVSQALPSVGLPAVARVVAAVSRRKETPLASLARLDKDLAQAKEEPSSHGPEHAALGRFFDSERREGGEPRLVLAALDAPAAPRARLARPKARVRPSLAATVAPAPAVSPDFGTRNGAEIGNKATVLSEVDRALGRDKPPALEYIFVSPLALWRLPDGSGIGTNPYGHAVVRYTLPGGEQKVMNIVGKPGREMVNFVKPEDYLYGTNVFDTGSEQGGVYNRGMFSLRIEELPPEKLVALDRYYTELQRRSHSGEAGFSLIMSRVKNFFAILLGQGKRWGNCAAWSSSGLVEAGILDKKTYWPKKLWAKLYEKYARQDPSNVHAVSYRRIHHAVQTYGKVADTHGLIAPLHPFSSARYWDLEDYSSVVVEVPEGSMTARVRAQSPRKR